MRISPVLTCCFEMCTIFMQRKLFVHTNSDQILSSNFERLVATQSSIHKYTLLHSDFIKNSTLIDYVLTVAWSKIYLHNFYLIVLCKCWTSSLWPNLGFLQTRIVIKQCWPTHRWRNEMKWTWNGLELLSVLCLTWAVIIEIVLKILL